MSTKTNNKTHIILTDTDTNFFTNIGPNLAKKCNQTWQYFGTECENTLTNIPTTSEEIMVITKKININKVSYIGNLSSEILRDAFMGLSARLSQLFNTCFDTAVIPPEWKIAKITLLPKAGITKLVSNYRPISLLPLMSRLIERNCTY